MSVRMSGAMPEGERNGLASLAHALIARPSDTRVAIVLFRTHKLTTNVTTGDVVPTVQLLAIEPMTEHETDAAELRRLMRRAVERRTGAVELPLDLERVLEETLNLNDETEEDR